MFDTDVSTVSPFPKQGEVRRADQDQHNRLMLRQLTWFTTRDHDVDVVIKGLVRHAIAYESRKCLEQVRSFNTFHRNQRLTRRDLESALK